MTTTKSEILISRHKGSTPRPIPSATKRPTSQRRGRAYDPWDHADQIGLQVIERPIRTANELWLPDHHTLVIRSTLRAVHKRTALAHGVAHAELGHRDDRPKHEHQADRLSALYLIDPLELDDVARWARHDHGLICAELGITRRVLAAHFRAG